MHSEGIRNIGLAMLAGFLTAGMLTVFVGQLPPLTVAPAYVQFQLALFFALLGVLPLVGREATTARGRLVAIFVMTASVSAVVMLGLLEFDLVGLLVYVPIALGSAAGVAGGLSTNVLSPSALFRGVSLLASFLFAFALIYVIALMWRTGSANFLVPFLIVTAAFVATVNGLQKEVAASTAP